MREFLIQVGCWVLMLWMPVGLAWAFWPEISQRLQPPAHATCHIWDTGCCGH